MIRRYLLKLLGYPNLTIAGRLPVVRTADELDRLIADRHRKGDAARKGWLTRREGVGG